MKILLIALPFHQGQLNDRQKKKIKRGVLPSLGIGYIAGVLMEEGHEVSLIDAQALGYSISDILDEVRRVQPQLIGISFLTPHRSGAYDLIETLKRDFSDIPVVVGGSHATCFPQETMEECKGIDALVVGEGEYVMRDLVRCLQKGESFRALKGIYYREKDGRIVHGEMNTGAIDLESLPSPAWHLYPLTRYAPEPFESKKLPSTNIIVSRGCTYSKCTFCHRSGLLKRPYRIQSVEKTIREIEHLKNTFGIKEFIFYDDDVASNKRWFSQFCDELLKRKLSIVWSCRARSNRFDKDIFAKAKQAGCFSVAFGFESGNQDLLDNIQKGITLEDSRRAAAAANALGLEVVGTFMLALPGETPEKARRTIDFAIEIDCTYAAFIPTHPFRGTKLYDQCEQEGKIIPETYSGKLNKTRYIPSVTYVPGGYRDALQVEEMVKLGYRRFYLRPKYVLKHIKKINSLEALKRYYNGIGFLFGLF